jgi:hypothetical protein
LGKETEIGFQNLLNGVFGTHASLGHEALDSDCRFEFRFGFGVVQCAGAVSATANVGTSSS